MENIPETDEIDLLDLFSVLYKKKKVIIGITIISAFVAVLVSAISLLLPSDISYLPNEYTPRSVMLIDDSSASSGISSMLKSSLGSLSGLVGGMGLSSASTSSQLAMSLTQTHSFLDAIIDEFDLITRYKIKKHPKTESRIQLKKKLSVTLDTASGVFTISFTDIDPAFAQSVVNFSVDYLEKRFDELGVDKNKLEKSNLEQNIENTYKEILKLEAESRKLEQSASSGGIIPSIMLESTRIKNEIYVQQEVYAQLKIQFELLKVQMESKTPVFQIIERAEIPDKKSTPSRGMITIIATFASFFCAVLLVFVMEAISKIRNDPVAMKKITGHR